MRTSTLLVTITSVAATDVCGDTYNMCSDNNPAAKSVQYGDCVLTCTSPETFCDEPEPCADGTIPNLDKCVPQCPYSPDEDQYQDSDAYIALYTPAPSAEPMSEPSAEPTPAPSVTYTETPYEEDSSGDSVASLVSNSTIIPRLAYGDGHHSGRQLGGYDFFEKKGFLDSETGMVIISGQQYQIGLQIGCGSGIPVFEATHEGKPVAIKLVNDPIDAKEEIGFLEKLKDSENIVTILNSEVKSSSAAIVLELCTMDLNKWMVENVPENGLLPEQVIDEFVPFFSRAIQQMQDQGIVHNDLYPGNILKCGKVWKVTDFGWAGTRGLEDDLFVVGSNLYKLLTGSFFPNLFDRKPNYDLDPEYGPLGEFIQNLAEFKTIDDFNDGVDQVTRENSFKNNP